MAREKAKKTNTNSRNGNCAKLGFEAQLFLAADNGSVQYACLCHA
jgi:hypothetical protein